VAVGGMVVAFATLALGGCVQPPRDLAVSDSSASTAPPPSVLSAVGQSHAVTKTSQRPGTRPKAPPSPSPSPSPVTISDDAVRAWFAALNAFAEAGFDDDWRSPGLAATTVQPQLASEQAELRWYAAAGMIAAGAPQIESMQVSQLTSSSAMVTSCVGGVQFMKETINGASSNVSSGGHEELQVEVIDTPNAWKVKSEKKVGAQCQSQ
jgi:hypothetical protein